MLLKSHKMDSSFKVYLHEEVEVPVWLLLHSGAELPDGICYVPHHFQLREIHIVHLGRYEVDMNDYRRSPMPVEAH